MMFAVREGHVALADVVTEAVRVGLAEVTDACMLPIRPKINMCPKMSNMAGDVVSRDFVCSAVEAYRFSRTRLNRRYQRGQHACGARYKEGMRGLGLGCESGVPVLFLAR